MYLLYTLGRARDWVLRCLPAQSHWRILLLLITVTLLSLALSGQLLLRYLEDTKATQSADRIATVINLTRVALMSSHPEYHSYLLNELFETEKIEIYLAEKDDVLVLMPEDSLVQELRQSLIPPDVTSISVSRFASSHNGRIGLWVSFRIAEDEYWIRLGKRSRTSISSLEWLWFGSIGLILILGVGYWMALRISRPLEIFTEAVQQMGSRGHRQAIPPLPEIGVKEIKTLIRAFNRMSSDLYQVENNRNLILAGLSHDLRTPLTRLRLNLEFLSSSEEYPAMLNDLAQMDSIIGQFINYARSGDEASICHTDCDWKVLCMETIQTYSARNSTWQVILPSQPIWVKGAWFDLSRALSNLINNALQHGHQVNSAPLTDKPLRIASDRHAIEDLHPEEEYPPEGNNQNVTARDLPIEIRLSQYTKEWGCLEVLDRGAGIPPDQVERMKQPFTRFDHARSSLGGAGLGLAIVDRIVQQHQGKLDLLPREGGGLCARILLPLTIPPSPRLQETENN